MPEMVFYDQRLPLKRKWSASEGDHQTPSPPLPPLRLPRLPSLSDWANVKPVAPASSLLFAAMAMTKQEPEASPAPSPIKREASPTKKEAATAKPAPMRNTSRERMKAEQASLRVQAAGLETELTCLLQLRQERLAGRSSNVSSSSSDNDYGWQEMAQQQWDKRVVSERENKRLREAVNGLATEVKGLESLFKSRSSALLASLRQNAQLAVQVQALLAEGSQPEKSPCRSPLPPAKSQKQSPMQQSPRDVACAMEAPRSPWAL